MMKGGQVLGRRRTHQQRIEEDYGDPLSSVLSWLYVERDMTQKQVADVLGVPVSYVSERLARYGIAARRYRLPTHT